ncbi:copper transporter [Halobellus rubicundus]|uniref:Copper transporter n=1 Tax=Halobellus rubicundus TaxID=2996466 RepID=A0ABD5MEI4_9EURY
MSFVGRRLNLVLVVVLAVLAVGTVGATVLYQSGVSAVETQNEQLRAQNEQLREDLRSARERIDTLQSRVSELEDRAESLRSTLQTQNETLVQVREERNGYRSDLESLCEQWRQERDTVPEECEDVE